MDEYLYIIYFIISLIIIHYFLRHLFFEYITKLDKKGIRKDTDNFYNSYYKDSHNKKDRQLINNIAFLRKGLFSSVYDGDEKVLELNKISDGDTILSLNNNDCNFEIYLMQKLIQKRKNVKIVICKTNIFEIEKCSSLINKLGFQNSMETIYIDDIKKISSKLQELYPQKFQRIILKENIGFTDDRKLIFNLLKLLLADKMSFIFLKTLTFNPVNTETHKNFVLEKQTKIIDFWNYNFSTNQSIINDFIDSGYEINYKSVNILFLSIFYNPRDVINLLKLYFIELDLGLCDIFDWLGVYTLNLLYTKAYA
jgi:hypothetical protein